MCVYDQGHDMHMVHIKFIWMSLPHTIRGICLCQYLAVAEECCSQATQAILHGLLDYACWSISKWGSHIGRCHWQDIVGSKGFRLWLPLLKVLATSRSWTSCGRQDLVRVSRSLWRSTTGWTGHCNAEVHLEALQWPTAVMEMPILFAHDISTLWTNCNNKGLPILSWIWHRTKQTHPGQLLDLDAPNN